MEAQASKSISTVGPADNTIGRIQELEGGHSFSEYLSRLIAKGLYTEYFEIHAGGGQVHFKGIKMPANVLTELWNGYVSFEVEQKRSCQFTHFYYTSDLYRLDYEEVLGREYSSVYSVNQDGAEYRKLKERINLRYSEWMKSKGLSDNTFVA